MKGQWSREKQATGWAVYDNIPITLTPHSRIKTTSGGVQWSEEEPRPPQVWGAVRSGGFKGNDTHVAETTDGTVEVAEVTLIGPVGALVAVHDTFAYNGAKMIVVNVRRVPDGTYAEAVRHG